MPPTLTVSRSVHSELANDGKFKIFVQTPPDLVVGVPAELAVPAGATITFAITLDSTAVPSGQVRQATLLIGKGKKQVRFPITIVRS